MRTLHSPVGREILAGAIVLAASVLAAWFFADIAVELLLKRALADRGFPTVRVNVRDVTPNRAVIEDLRLDDDGRLTAESLVATYSPLGLLRGEIQTLRIVGARWVVHVRDRGVDLGPVEVLLDSPSAGLEGEGLPVQRIELVGSEVIVESATQSRRVPIEGVLDRVPDGFQVWMWSDDESLSAEWFADVRQRPRLHADLALSIRRGRAELDALGQLATDGRIHVRLRAYHWSMDSVLAGRHVAVDDLSAELAFAGSVDETQVLLTADRGGSVRARRVRFGAGDDRPVLEDLQLEVGSIGAAPLLRVSRGGGGADTVESAVELAGDASKVSIAGALGTVRRIGVQVQAHRVAGAWDLLGRAEALLAPLVHARAGVRIEEISASVVLRYPFSRPAAAAPGHVRVGPVRWRGSTFPPLRGELTQRGDALLVSLDWPLTADVSARARGRIGLATPLEGELRITAPPFALEEAAQVAVLERALGGSIRGTAALDGHVDLRGGAVTPSMQVRLDDVLVSRSSRFPFELQGLTGTLRLHGVPARTESGQRLSWRGGRIGKLPLGAGHVDFALDRSLVVEALTSEIAQRGGGGRLSVLPFRYARERPELRLRIVAESLSLQHLLELFGRGKVTGTGRLHGEVAARIRLGQRPQLHVESGRLQADPGGMLALRDLGAAEEVLASAATPTDAKAFSQTVKQRLLGALQSFRYSSLRAEILRERGSATLRVHLAGRGTRGARQEIGGLTLNVHGFEDALNQLLRRYGGAGRSGSHAPKLSYP